MALEYNPPASAFQSCIGPNSSKRIGKDVNKRLVLLQGTGQSEGRLEELVISASATQGHLLDLLL
jgi:hypothetical protein